MNSFIVTIKQIDWLDKDNPEAEILFEINGRQLWAFCHTFDFKEGEIAEVNFSFLEEGISESAFWGENKENKRDIVTSENNRWRYYCYGQLKSIHPVIIDCGDITFSSGNWLNDERVIGSYVYFVISRLDISRD
ncbi:hypothetical protein [Emticicia sp. 21SJ11W-3]|uniref:hypothetical protein n=1 Tax=Emticicia sp. 21SJ11W-3 TaxID=2916755 RepID=UPI00209F99FB|nr:hypothetical protein [Emticicia sp. 21SJ11W-3]UTA66460.1 hypothetical protein MB380_12710 [Emticicia sp. 21SJ11W-3]